MVALTVEDGEKEKEELGEGVRYVEKRMDFRLRWLVYEERLQPHKSCLIY